MTSSRSLTFDCFDFKHYLGFNLYLKRAALVFSWQLVGTPLAIVAYQEAIAQFFPNFAELDLTSYAELFAQILTLIGCLGADLPPSQVAIIERGQEISDRLALECLDFRTSRGVVYLAWDWLEAISQQQVFPLTERLQSLQDMFRRSVYGSPTVFALLQKAKERQIPAFFLWDEGLMQYGYGCYQIRSLATIFDRDNVLDSDFTTQKDDCKAFLEKYGFPVPKGKIVDSLAEAEAVIAELGFPLAVKPVVGHEGIGVTARVDDEAGLRLAYGVAVAAIAADNSAVMIEQSLVGIDCRLLTVGGRFRAAMERRPPFVIGDGESTIQQLIDRENATSNRLDTPTSPLGKIAIDEILENHLTEQGLTLESILPSDRLIELRKVANISSGGVSVDITGQVHSDNRQLAEDIAHYFGLVAMGIDVIAEDLSRSWREGNFAIIEINASPGIFMHTKPAIGSPIDVTGYIFDELFPKVSSGRIPIFTFNDLPTEDIPDLWEQIWSRFPHYKIGIVTREGVWFNRSPRIPHPDYNTNIQSLLRHPQLDLLIAEYSEDIFLKAGLFYEGSDLIVLSEPTEVELRLTEATLPHGIMLVEQNQQICFKTGDLEATYKRTSPRTLRQLYRKAIASLLR